MAVAVVVPGWSLNIVRDFMPEAWGLMVGVAERAVLLEEIGRFLLLAVGGAAVLDWGAIVVAEPGGGLAAAEIVTRGGAGIFDRLEGAEGA